MTKGAHVYYFKSKLDLMKLTVEHLFDQVHRKVADSVAARPRTLRDVESALQTTAEVTLHQEGIALYEVWMASRTDGALRRVFSKLEAANETNRSEALSTKFGPELAQRVEVQMAMKAVTLIVRGLALQQILRHDAAKSPEWLYWRRRMAQDIYACMRSVRSPR